MKHINRFLNKKLNTKPFNSLNRPLGDCRKAPLSFVSSLDKKDKQSLPIETNENKTVLMDCLDIPNL